MIFCMISNKSSIGVKKFQFYRQKDLLKELRSAGYKRLFLCLVFNVNTATRQISYFMETDFAHETFWKYHFTIRDNSQITIGAIVHMYHVRPIYNIMPDNCHSIFSKKPNSVMR